MFTRKMFLAAAAGGVVLGGLVAIGHVAFGPQIVGATQPVPSPQFVNSRQQLEQIPIIKDKVLTANHNYQYLYGTVQVTDTLSGISSKDEIWLEQPSKFKLLFTPDTSKPNQTIIAVNDGSKVQVQGLDGIITDSNPVQAPQQVVTPADNEVIPDLNGTFLPTGNINEMLHTELFEQSIFRRGTLTVVGEDTYLGRPTKVLDVHLAASKLGDEQKFWIDNGTGLVLRTVLYSKGSPIQDYSFTNVDFSPVDPSVFNLINPNA